MANHPAPKVTRADKENIIKIITKKLKPELGGYIKDLSRQIAKLHDKAYTGDADKFDMEHLHELQGEYEVILSNPESFVA